jgi:hypothetical protein
LGIRIETVGVCSNESGIESSRIFINELSTSIEAPSF